MSEWKWAREREYTALDAVNALRHQDGWGGALATHPVVASALAQIDIAERAIASIAEELEYKHNEEEDVL